MARRILKQAPVDVVYSDPEEVDSVIVARLGTADSPKAEHADQELVKFEIPELLIEFSILRSELMAIIGATDPPQGKPRIGPGANMI